MDNGTACDLLGNKPRTTNIIYMCAPRSSNEVRHWGKFVHTTLDAFENDFSFFFSGKRNLVSQVLVIIIINYD